MDEDYISVEVERVEMTPGSTVAVGWGFDVATREPISFGGDWRQMQDLAEALANEEFPVAEVPLWAVLNHG